MKRLREKGFSIQTILSNLLINYLRKTGQTCKIPVRRIGMITNSVQIENITLRLPIGLNLTINRGSIIKSYATY